MKINKYLAAIMIALSPITLSGCASYTLAPIILTEEGKLIDTRSNEAYTEKHIAGALNIDFDNPNAEQTLSGLSRSAQYVLYGDNGADIENVFNLMIENGFVNVSIAGSLEATATAVGLPIEP